MSALIRLAHLSVVAMLVVGCAERATVLTEAPVAPTAEPEPIRRIAIEDMRFQDESLAIKARRLHAAAVKMAKPDWQHEPYENTSRDPAYAAFFASWCTFPEKYHGLDYTGPKEFNSIRIGALTEAANSAPDIAKTIRGIGLSAFWKPVNTGWGAHLTYQTCNGKPRGGRPDEDFHCRFTYYVGREEQAAIWFPSIELYRDGYAYYSQNHRFGKADKYPTDYHFFVATKDWDSFSRLKSIVPDDEVRKILQSPESFRDYLVATYAALSKQLSAEIPAGRGVEKSMYDVRQEYRQQPPISRRPLSDAEKQQIVTSALNEVTLKIRTVQEHYREMYAALGKAFPRQDCIRE